MLYIGSSILEEIEQGLVKFLKVSRKSFAWKHEDMTCISIEIITQKLNMDPSFRPIHKRRRKFAPEWNQIIQEQVEKILKT